MKKILLYILFISFVPEIVFADATSIDSLEIELTKKNIPDSIRIEILYQLAFESTFHAPDNALIYTKKVIELSKKIKNPKYMGDALSLEGKVYKNNGDYKKAIAVHLKALKIKESIADIKGQCTSYNDIGIVYKSMKNFKVALVFYRKANALAYKSNFTKAIANTLNNIGTAHFELQQIDSAILNYNKALVVALNLKDDNVLATTYNNLGNIYGYDDKPKQALSYYLKSLELDEKRKDEYGMIYSLLNIGESYKELKQYDESQKYFLRAEEICLKNNAKPLLKEVYHSIGDGFNSSKNFEQAYSYMNKYSILKDSLLTDESTQQIAEMQTRFESEKKDLQIKNQTAEIAIDKADLEEKKTFNFILLATVLLTLLISYLFYNRYKLKQKALLDAEIIKQQELRSKAIIEAEENERRRIALDLHDGIGQLLSAAKMNLSGLEDKLNLDNLETQTLFKNSIDLVDDSVKEIRAVSHNMMPNALLKSGLVAAIRELVNKLNTGNKFKIDLEINGLNERLEPTTEAILYRVLQEIVSNIVKHAKASHISIQLIKHDSELTAMLEDNGVGFDAQKINDFNGIGLKNIQSRIAFLKGNVIFDSTPGKGTTVVIDIPI